MTGLSRPTWDRTAPDEDEDWNRDDPPRERKPVQPDTTFKPVQPPLVYGAAIQHVQLEQRQRIERHEQLRSLPRNVRMFWKSRPCWVCEAEGVCPHREFEVAVAYVTSSPGPEIRFEYLKPDNDPSPV